MNLWVEACSDCPFARRSSSHLHCCHPVRSVPTVPNGVPVLCPLRDVPVSVYTDAQPPRAAPANSCPWCGTSWVTTPGTHYMLDVVLTANHVANVVFMPCCEQVADHVMADGYEAIVGRPIQDVVVEFCGFMQAVVT